MEVKLFINVSAVRQLKAEVCEGGMREQIFLHCKENGIWKNVHTCNRQYNNIRTQIIIIIRFIMSKSKQENNNRRIFYRLSNFLRDISQLKIKKKNIAILYMVGYWYRISYPIRI